MNASPADLAANEALKLLHEVSTSDKTYGIYTGSALPIQGGLEPLGRTEKFAAANFSVTPDDRPGKKRLPPDGFHGVAGVASDFASFASAGDGRPVSRALVLFHELAENQLKTEKIMQYAQAHPGAIERERALRAQRPELEKYALGAGLFRRRIDK